MRGNRGNVYRRDISLCTLLIVYLTILYLNRVVQVSLSLSSQNFFFFFYHRRFISMAFLVMGRKGRHRLRSEARQPKLTLGLEGKPSQVLLTKYHRVQWAMALGTI